MSIPCHYELDTIYDILVDSIALFVMLYFTLELSFYKYLGRNIHGNHQYRRELHRSRILKFDLLEVTRVSLTSVTIFFRFLEESHLHYLVDIYLK